MSTTKIQPRRHRLRLRPEVDEALAHLAVARGATVPEVIATAVEEVVVREGWLRPAPPTAPTANTIEEAT